MSVWKFAASAMICSYLGFNNADCQSSSLKSENISVRVGSGFTYHMSQSRLESRLDSLARDPKTRLEDAWLFHNGKVVDIGIAEEERNVVINDMRVSMEISDAKPGDTIIFYHIHPDSYKNGRFSPPSSCDLIAHASMKRYMIHSRLVFVNKMLDGRGIWKFDLDDDLMSRLNEKGDVQRGLCSDLNSYIIKNCEIADNHSKWIIVNGSHDAGPYDASTIKKYISAMQKFGVKLEFLRNDKVDVMYYMLH
jgi:hypothetical protein